MSIKQNIPDKERLVFTPLNASLPQYIREFGYGNFKDARQSHPIHRHEELYEICYIASGLVHFKAEGENCEIGRGQLQFVKPGDLHGGVNKMIHPSTVYWLAFDFNRFCSLTGNLFTDLIKAFKKIDRHFFYVPLRLTTIFENLVNHCYNQTPLAKSILTNMINDLLLEIIQGYQDCLREEHNRQKERERKITLAINWITTHLYEQFSIEDAAHATGLKISRFHQLFLQETGFTPTDYVNRQRIEAAKKRLKTSKTSVTTLAFDLGFTSSQYFATVFKKYCGMTPSAYRKQNMIDRETG